MIIFICIIEMSQEGLEEFFFDYKKDNWDKDFAFIIDVGITFSYLFKEIIIRKN